MVDPINAKLLASLQLQFGWHKLSGSENIKNGVLYYLYGRMSTFYLDSPSNCESFFFVYRLIIEMAWLNFWHTKYFITMPGVLEEQVFFSARCRSVSDSIQRFLWTWWVIQIRYLKKKNTWPGFLNKKNA